MKSLIEELGLDTDVENKTMDKENAFIQKNSHLNIPSAPQSYRRYGYGLLNYTAKKFLYEWLTDYNEQTIFKNLQAKITNSGMGAIDLVLKLVALCYNKKRLLVAKDMYFATQELLQSYEGTLIEKIDWFESKEELENLKKTVGEDTILFVESISNSFDLIEYDENSLVDYSEYFGAVIVDGSLQGLCRTKPILLEKPNLFYVESLSKHYHPGPSSTISAGILIYHNEHEKNVQKLLETSGIYLQIADLAQLPVDMYFVGKKRIFSIAQNMGDFYRDIKNLKCITHSDLSLRSRMPTVVFLNLRTKKSLEFFMKEANLDERESYGHDNTVALPLGLLLDGASSGLLRIAIGTKGVPQTVLTTLREVDYEIHKRN